MYWVSVRVMMLRVRLAQWVRYLDYLTNHTNLSPIRRGFAPGFNKECTRLAAASNNAYQLLAHGRWFSPGTPASSTTKIGRHDIAEILLIVASSTINQIKSNVMIFSATFNNISVISWRSILLDRVSEALFLWLKTFVLIVVYMDFCSCFIWSFQLQI